jgi:NAD dependent epimerase/dehydratase family enzyme
MSWVSLHDAVGAFYWALTQPEVEGALNAVGPEPVSSAEFARTLGRVLRRPAIFPAPAFALRLAFGEMADEALLSGQRVKPSALLSSGYPMLHQTLEEALRFELGRVAPTRRPPSP